MSILERATDEPQPRTPIRDDAPGEVQGRSPESYMPLPQMAAPYIMPSIGTNEQFSAQECLMNLAAFTLLTEVCMFVDISAVH